MFSKHLSASVFYLATVLSLARTSTAKAIAWNVNNTFKSVLTKVIESRANGGISKGSGEGTAMVNDDHYKVQHFKHQASLDLLASCQFNSSWAGKADTSETF